MWTYRLSAWAGPDTKTWCPACPVRQHQDKLINNMETQRQVPVVVLQEARGKQEQAFK